ncbi:MAG: DUF2155 domain-containing protein [Nitrospiraceae bacterium]|nr:DUF2155 domain-containing protein [Nitrospiraceae bacterium]
MFRKSFLLLLIVAVAFALSFASCKKKEETPAAQGPQTPGINMPLTEPRVTVPADVKKTWSAVVLVIEDKTTGKSSEATVRVGSDYGIPGSDMRIHVAGFLPDFRMSDSEITSASNEPNNPAARVEVFKGKTRIFKGWLFVLYPAIHPFQNDRYGVTLKKGVKKA